MMATNVATALEIDRGTGARAKSLRPVSWEEWITLPIREFLGRCQYRLSSVNTSQVADGERHKARPLHADSLERSKRMSADNPIQIHATGDATGFIPSANGNGKPITVIGTNSIRASFDSTCLQQTLNARSAPGVTDLVLNPDGHGGYGAPIGCVLVSPTHIYPGPVGVDIKCSMSFLQMDFPAEQLTDKLLSARQTKDARRVFPNPNR